MQVPDRYDFCTYFDKAYLVRGIALYESLKNNCKRPFRLWVLCFDEETLEIIKRLNLPGVMPIGEGEFLANETALRSASANRSRIEFYWTCTPALPLFLLKRVPDIEAIVYLDADTFFFNDPVCAFEELGDGSVLIVEHKFAPEYSLSMLNSGRFNVEFLIFRNDSESIKVLESWRAQCIDWCYARHEPGRYGDQLYLDEWPEKFKCVRVSGNKGLGVAPWNIASYSITKKNDCLYADESPLVFYHFHKCDLYGFGICSPNLTYKHPAKNLVLTHLPYLASIGRSADKLISQAGFNPFSDVDLGVFKKIRHVLKYNAFANLPFGLSGLLWRWAEVSRSVEAGLDKGYKLFKDGERCRAALTMLRCVFLRPFIIFRPGVAAIIAKGLLR